MKENPGFGMERMIVSIHKNYSEYVKLKSEMTRKWGMVAKIESFVVSLEGDDIILPLSLKNFANNLKKQNLKMVFPVPSST